MAGAAGAIHGGCHPRNDGGSDPALRADGRMARRGAASTVHARSFPLHPGDRTAAEGELLGVIATRQSGFAAGLLRSGGRGLFPHPRTLTPFSAHSWSTSTSSEAQSARVRHWIVSRRLPVIGSTLRQYRVVGVPAGAPAELRSAVAGASVSAVMPTLRASANPSSVMSFLLNPTDAVPYFRSYVPTSSP